MTKKHRIGMTVPFAENRVPDEGLVMYPGHRIRAARHRCALADA